jgi:predicted amidohydrolase/glycerophosphoryl diester phosphodiesterase
MRRIIASAMTLLALAALPSGAAPMKARVIQQLFCQDRPGLENSFEWTINELKKCDESLDIVVLPEFSEVPGKTTDREDFLNTARQYGPILLETCAQTAKRCSTLVFAGAIDFSTEAPRNTIFVFNRNGEIIGRYYKEHLTRGEWDKLDMSYTEEWTQPYILDIEGVRYAFLTCYDFYFYENFSNIARWKPDVIIGSSHQRSDTFRALDIINTFCAYNTGAYLVRASVSMGLDSELGGCSCIVAPTGEILGTLRSEVTTLDATFDPKQKYLKPAGYGNPPALHSEYIEIGRRPWKYRPGGSAIVTPFDEAPAKRLCANQGLSSFGSGNLLASLGAAAAVGASEIGFEIGPADDAKLTEILKKLSCHAVMNIRLAEKKWDKASLKKVADLVFAYDAQDHVYFTTGDVAVLDILAVVAPKIPRCMAGIEGQDIVGAAVKHGCKLVQLSGASLDKAMVEKAKTNGLRCNVTSRNDPEEASKLFGMGADTIITDNYLTIADATGVK